MCNYNLLVYKAIKDSTSRISEPANPMVKAQILGPSGKKINILI